MAQLRWTKSVGPTQVVKLSVGDMDNNVYVLSEGGESLLVDGSNEAGVILEHASGLSTIIQTHGHGDHIVALPELVDRTGATVFAHPDDAARMPVATQALNDGDEIGLGTATLEVLHTPGHTPGSVCFVLRHGQQTHLFAGDTLFPGGPGGTFGDAAAFERIIDSVATKLFTLPDDTQVYPGHGDDTTIGTEKPHLEEWRARGW